MYIRKIKSRNTGKAIVYFGKVREAADVHPNYARVFAHCDPNDVFCVVSYQDLDYSDYAHGIEAIDMLADTGSGLVQGLYRRFATFRDEYSVEAAMLRTIQTCGLYDKYISVKDFILAEIDSEIEHEVTII